ncbi:hypothetical protein G6O67_002558 [Ophiocordyceps sinensis]|uniref:Peptidase M43 pregnancy-associated plasma-A domain-containing protein n=1 Tax=Ophiocordyceps sinensis TaxID=72228 RepID=A0A8H4PUF0_9HYPO|nr:hypothetical protein G6O67_002558 [Ophiocordyceps sinensis]
MVACLTLVLATVAMVAPLANCERLARCGMQQPNELLARRALSEFAAMEANDTAPPSVNDLPLINVDLYMHVLASSENSTGSPSRDRLNKQLDVLTKAFEPVKISFTLRDIDWTVNTTWAVAKERSTFVEMQQALGKGNASTLNLYFLEAIYDKAVETVIPADDEQDPLDEEVESTIGETLLGVTVYPWRMGSGDDNYVLATHYSVPGSNRRENFIGMTAVHEVGHWFGLLHTFGGSCTSFGDLVADTPVSANATNGCPTSRDSCPDQPGLDPIHNYMDYSDDACMSEFTPGQMRRIHAMWNKYRNPNARPGIPKPGFDQALRNRCHEQFCSKSRVEECSVSSANRTPDPLVCYCRIKTDVKTVTRTVSCKAEPKL